MFLSLFLSNFRTLWSHYSIRLLLFYLLNLNPFRNWKIFSTGQWINKTSDARSFSLVTLLSSWVLFNFFFPKHPKNCRMIYSRPGMYKNIFPFIGSITISSRSCQLFVFVTCTLFPLVPAGFIVVGLDWYRSEPWVELNWTFIWYF